MLPIPKFSFINTKGTDPVSTVLVAQRVGVLALHTGGPGSHQSTTETGHSGPHLAKGQEFKTTLS